MAPDIPSILKNIKQFFEQEKDKKKAISLENILDRMVLATGLSRSMICRNFATDKPESDKKL